MFKLCRGWTTLACEKDKERLSTWNDSLVGLCMNTSYSSGSLFFIKKEGKTIGQCRAIKTKGMVFRYTWVYSKEDTMAHTYRPMVTSCGPKMTKFSLLDGAFPSVVVEGTELHCKKEAWICGMSGLLGLMWEQFLVSCPPVASTCVS